MGSFYNKEGNLISCTTISTLEDLDIDPLKVVKLKVVGRTKGRGFAGVMKRYQHQGGPATHGQSDRQRAIGSTGPSTPGRVFKGLKMPGRYGNDRYTINSSKIISVDKDKKEIIVKGPIPGYFNAKVTLTIYEE